MECAQSEHETLGSVVILGDFNADHSVDDLNIQGVWLQEVLDRMRENEGYDPDLKVAWGRAKGEGALEANTISEQCLQ